MRRIPGISRFRKDERGTVAILWAISLVAFLGLIAVSFEVGKLSTTHGELQSFVDSVALAAAGELDGEDDAITRAQNAAAKLISDRHTFGDEDATLFGDTDTDSDTEDYTLTFHTALPSDDSTALGGGTATTDPNEAAFVEVTAKPKTVVMTFLKAVNGLLGNPAGTDPQVSATAVAGFTQAACDITPLMFCLPSDWETTLNVGDLILLRSGGQGTAWGPGNFGFIDLDEFEDSNGVCADEGGNLLACLIAAQEGITECVTTRGIDTEPGQKNGITNAAFNVRFDMFRATLNGEKNNPDFAPAPNVIKGIEKNGGGNGCIQGNEQPTVDTIALPRDDCMPGCGRFGDGVWDRQGYLDVNHDLADGVDDDSGSDTHLPALSVENAQYAGTRFGMYLREIAYGDTNPFSPPDEDAILDPSLSETGRPQCSNNMSTNPRRRVIIAAGVDCVANGIAGSTEDVPVEKYVEIFLTEPVGDDGGSPPSFDIHGEVIGFPDQAGGGAAGQGGIFRDIVQLYR